jgi:hypothetical protein
MRILQTVSVLSVLLFSGIAHATTTTVTATGNCPSDPANIQSAINAALPGDTIQLLPGPSNLAFNFACGTSVSIQTLGLTVEGTAGATLINGQGSTSGEIGFFILSDDVTVTGVGFQNFVVGILASNADTAGSEPGPSNLTVTNSRFLNNGVGILVLGVCDHARLTNNDVHVPATSVPSGNAGIVIVTRDSDLLVADNTVTGPGASGLLHSLDQFIDGTVDSIAALSHTFGIQQIDFVPPTSIRGRISGNVLTGLDFGLQASSNFGVVMQNTATKCEVGLLISNDADDGVTRVNNELVSLNTSRNNQIGFIVASGTQNTVALNDFSNNHLAGLFFVANPGGAPSIGNQFGCNQGSVKNFEGNAILPPCKDE